MLKTATEVPRTIELRAAVPEKEGLNICFSLAGQPSWLYRLVSAIRARSGHWDGASLLGDAWYEEDGRGRDQASVEESEVEARHGAEQGPGRLGNRKHKDDKVHSVHGMRPLREPADASPLLRVILG